MSKKALLVGNDINNATSQYSWSDLLNGLIAHARIVDPPSMIDKPFPLLYEEIYLNSANLHHTKEIDLKRFIAKQTQRLEPNKIHKHIADLGIHNIFTTNYDLTIEKAIDPNHSELKNDGVIKERLYSLFRRHKVGRHNVWHLHGSELAPNTITLGYEHYGGYLQLMRNYLISGTKDNYQHKDFKALVANVKHESIQHHSWMGYFFSHDIFIFGLNLDFVEMHLWWFLTIRARFIVEGSIDINNKIYYYYPDIFEDRSKAKLDLLKVNGVKNISINMKDGDRLDYYNRVLEDIKSR